MKFKIFTLFAIVLCSAVAFFYSVSSGAEAAGGELLFTISNETGVQLLDRDDSDAAIREKRIDFAVDSFNAGERHSVKFPLLDGKVYEAVQTSREGTERRSLRDFTWRGKISEGEFSGDAVFSFKNGAVAGIIYSPDSVYEITSKGGEQYLVELDQSRFPECAGDVSGEQNFDLTDAGNFGTAADSGDRIDVLVVYTPATKNILGGSAAAEALAQASIDSTNTAYINSKIRQRVRLVHSAEYNYTETSSASADLSALRNNAAIQALRNTHNADLVAMIGEIQGACGIGYLMGAVSTGSQNNGFTFTGRTCAVGNLSFAHELGHNMGSTHNPENGSSASFPYGYGHYVNGSYRTVMSYADPCTQGCTRRPYFSNPSISFNGFATGIDNQRDNARSIENTADFIANYRYSGKSITMLNFNAGEFLPRNILRTVNWDSNNVTGNVRIEISRDESTNWETVVADTPNDGSQAISVPGRPTRRARVRVTSVADPTVSDSSNKNIFIR